MSSTFHYKVNASRPRTISVIVSIGTFLISSELLVFRPLNHFLDGLLMAWEHSSKRRLWSLMLFLLLPSQCPNLRRPIHTANEIGRIAKK